MAIIVDGYFVDASLNPAFLEREVMVGLFFHPAFDRVDVLEWTEAIIFAVQCLRCAHLYPLRICDSAPGRDSLSQAVLSTS